jgi:hypothetical protein
MTAANGWYEEEMSVHNASLSILRSLTFWSGTYDCLTVEALDYLFYVSYDKWNGPEIQETYHHLTGCWSEMFHAIKCILKWIYEYIWISALEGLNCPGH